MPIVSPKIPQGLEELMRGLAKSVIKENPENIYEFAAEYFENLLRERDGTVDQRYKKFATYKVYKKNKMARKQQRDKELISIKPSTGYDLEQGSSSSKQNSDYESIEKIILPPSHMALPREQLSVSSESEINTSVRQEAFVEVEGATPTRKESASQDDDDIENMVLDDDMEQAALKIQSTFRGHKVRRDMKDSKNSHQSASDDGEKGSELNMNSDGHASEIESEIISSQNEPDIDNDILSNPAEEVLSQDKPNNSSLVVSDEGGQDNEIIPLKESVDIESDDIEPALPQQETECNSVITASQEEMVLSDTNVQEINDVCDVSKIEKSQSIEQEMASITPPQETNENDEIAGMVLDDEMEEAALKIQSAFRGHKVRKEMSSFGTDVPENEQQLDSNNEFNPQEPKIDEGLIENSLESTEIMDENNLNGDELSEGIELEKNGLEDENQQPEIESVQEKVVEQIESIECDKIDNPELIESSDEILMNENSPLETMVDEELQSNDDKIITESTQELNDDEIALVEEVASAANDHSLTKTESMISVEGSPIENEINDNESSIMKAEDSEIAAIENLSSEEINDEVPLATDSDMNDGNLAESIEIESTNVLEKIPSEESEIKSFEEIIPATPGDNDSVEILEKEDSIKEATGSIEREDESLNVAIVNDSVELTNDESFPEQPCIASLEEKSENSTPNDDDNIITEQAEATSHDEACVIEAEDTQIATSPSQDENLINDDRSTQISVEEELCEQKIISNLQPEQQQSQDEMLEESAIEDDILDEDKKASLEKMSSSEIKYEKLQESLDGGKMSPASIERQDTEEKSIDAESSNSRCASDDNETPMEQEEMAVEKETIKLEQILQHSISPIELIDEVVNEVATMRADEIFGTTNSDVEQIIKPELIKLETEEHVTGEELIDPIKDEILTPEKEESEIPEETQNPIDEPLVIEDQDEQEIETVVEPSLSLPEENNSDINEENPIDEPKDIDERISKDESQENLGDMILDDEMEEAAIKIQAAFRGHKTRKETFATTTTLKSESEEQTNENENENENNADSTTIVIDQCSEANEETQDQDDTEQQDTSADVDEIQESEAITGQENNTEEQEEEVATEEQDDTEEQNDTNDTAEEGEDGETGVDDPDQAEPEQPVEGEASQANEDDDIANMVLDDEMEQAALKIQSTFRGHKTRKENKTQPEEVKTEEPETSKKSESAENLDDDIANMVLDDEMEQAALKIQSTFRGHKVRKDKQTENTESEQKTTEEPEPEETKDEEASKQEEEQPQSSSEEKSAQQLQDEEDIANIVMDDEMEKTALKIQSAFRGKFKRKQPKDGEESFESSAENGSDYGDESPQKSEESPADVYEYFSNENASDERYSYDEVDYNYTANRQSYTDDVRYSVDRYDSNEQCEQEAIYPLSNKSEDDINLMHGGGIFVEASHESQGGSEILSGSSSDGDKEDPNRNDDSKKASFTSNASNEDLIESKEEIEVLDEKIIESFDFDQNRDTAEALYYSLKKNEIEAQKRFHESIRESSTDSEKNEELLPTAMNESLEEDNDDVVVQSTSAPKILKYGMSMDDRLLGSILSQDYSQKARKIYPDDGFDPLLEESMRNHPLFLERLHELSRSGEEEDEELPVTFDPENMGDEDQFDDFYPGNIRSKMMASSISIADSDYFDPTNNKSIIDDATIRTALETIHSTDSESTIASGATKIHAGERHLMTRRNNNQYSSIGNAAIDKSLDDFIQAQEMRVVDKLDEEPEGSCNSPPPARKQESNDDTCTSDTCTESDKKHPIPGVIGIKLEQKQSHFLTVDERRGRLHREDAIQRNSTRSQEEDSSKSSSSEKIIDKNIVQSEAAIVTVVQGQSSIIDTEIAVPVLDKQATKPPSNINKSVKVPIIRQKTMPVQIESNIIRVLPPKHLRKRIKSAESSDKKRRITK